MTERRIVVNSLRLDEDRVAELREKLEAKNRIVRLDEEMKWVNRIGQKVSFLGRDVWIWQVDIKTTWETVSGSGEYGQKVSNPEWLEVELAKLDAISTVTVMWMTDEGVVQTQKIGGDLVEKILVGL